MALAIGAGVTAALAALKAGSAATALKTAGAAAKAGAVAVKGARTANKAALIAKAVKKAPKVTNRLQAAQAAIKNQGLRQAVGERAMEAAPEGLQKRITGAQGKIQKAKDWGGDTFWDFEGGDEARQKFQKRAVGNIRDQLRQASEPAESGAGEPTMDQYGQDIAELRRKQRGY